MRKGLTSRIYQNQTEKKTVLLYLPPFPIFLRELQPYLPDRGGRCFFLPHRDRQDVLHRSLLREQYIYMSPSKASRRASRGRRCVSIIPNRKGDNLWKERQQDHLARRPPATLEQRRQVRYLARYYPDLKTHRIAKAVNCSYSAVPKILANTFGGGDTDLDALPRDKEFLCKYGVQDEDVRSS